MGMFYDLMDSVITETLSRLQSGRTMTPYMTAVSPVEIILEQEAHHCYSPRSNNHQRYPVGYDKTVGRWASFHPMIDSRNRRHTEIHRNTQHIAREKPTVYSIANKKGIKKEVQRKNYCKTLFR